MADNYDRGKVLVLQTPARQHVGFVLLHPDANAASGDCVFVIAPKGDEAERSQLARKLQSYKSGTAREFKFTRKVFAGSDRYVVKHTDLPALTMEIPRIGEGSIRQETSADQSLGVAFFAAAAGPNKEVEGTVGQ